MKTTATLTTNSLLQPQRITVVMYSGGRAFFKKTRNSYVRKRIS